MCVARTTQLPQHTFRFYKTLLKVGSRLSTILPIKYNPTVSMCANYTVNHTSANDTHTNLKNHPEQDRVSKSNYDQRIQNHAVLWQRRSKFSHGRDSLA